MRLLFATNTCGQDLLGHLRERDEVQAGDIQMSGRSATAASARHPRASAALALGRLWKGRDSDSDLKSSLAEARQGRGRFRPCSPCNDCGERRPMSLVQACAPGEGQSGTEVATSPRTSLPRVSRARATGRPTGGRRWHGRRTAWEREHGHGELDTAGLRAALRASARARGPCQGEPKHSAAAHAAEHPLALCTRARRI